MDRKISIWEKVIIIILAGIFDFFINYLFNIVLGVPLFLNTICLMVVLFLFGPIEAFFSYTIKVLCSIIRLYVAYHTFDYIYLYTLSAVVIIVISWLFIRKLKLMEGSINKVFLFLVVTAVVSAVFCSVVSGFGLFKLYERIRYAKKLVFSVSLAFIISSFF